MKKHKRMLIVAGGTGGHIIPAVALSRELSGFDCTFMCGSRKIERMVYQAEGITPEVLPLGSYSRMNMLLSALPCAFKSFAFIIKENIDVVLSSGSYMSAIPAAAALILGKPLFILEQDVRMGKANRIFARYAKAVFSGFDIRRGPSLRGNILHTGHVVKRETVNPSAHESGIKIPEGKRVLLVTGGSQGSSGMTENVLRAASKMDNLYIIAVAGMSVGRFSDSPSVKILPYVKNMGHLYSIADIVVSRAGALSFAELLSTGKKALFIPLPTSKDSHQRSNAMMFMRGRPQFDMMEEVGFDDDLFRRKVNALLDAPSPEPVAERAAESIKAEMEKYV